MFIAGKLLGNAFIQEKLKRPTNNKSANDHTLITGTSGTGKSYIGKNLYPNPDLLMNFKPDPLYKNNSKIGKLINIKVEKESEKNAFIDAFVYGMDIDIKGIMASQISPILRELLDKANNIKEMIIALNHENIGTIQGGIEKIIKNNLEAIQKMDEGKIQQNHIDLSNEIKLLQDFFAEFELRKLYNYNEINSNKISNNKQIYIEEMHHLGRKETILNQMLREYRTKGQIIGITQSLSDLDPEIMANFGHILIGKTINPRDIAIFRDISDILPKLIPRLPPRVFLNLEEFLEGEKNYLYIWQD